MHQFSKVRILCTDKSWTKVKCNTAAAKSLFKLSLHFENAFKQLLQFLQNSSCNNIEQIIYSAWRRMPNRQSFSTKSLFFDIKLHFIQVRLKIRIFSVRIFSVRILWTASILNIPNIWNLIFLVRKMRFAWILDIRYWKLKIEYFLSGRWSLHEY